MIPIQTVVGAAILILGRKLFWVFVGAIGFVLGMDIAGHFLQGRPDWLILIVAFGTGIIGALLALFLQRAAILVAGFFSGGHIAITLLSISGWQLSLPSWVPFIIGGIIGAVLLYSLFDWALVFLSSLSGAGLIVQSFPLTPQTQGLVFIGLVVLGVFIQAGLMKKERGRKK
jgi:hypothetical protein